MRFTRSNAKLVVVSPAEAPADAAPQALVEQYDLNDRSARAGLSVARTDREVRQRGVGLCLLPVDEDSVGYVTMEAFASAKAMLTVE
jgi:hypothetical protein